MVTYTIKVLLKTDTVLWLKTNLISCLLCLQDGTTYLHIIRAWLPKIVLTSVLTSRGLNVTIVVVFDSCTLRPIQSRQA